jgi:hypothetical protein
MTEKKLPFFIGNTKNRKPEISSKHLNKLNLRL